MDQLVPGERDEQSNGRPVARACRIFERRTAAPAAKPRQTCQQPIETFPRIDDRPQVTEQHMDEHEANPPKAPQHLRQRVVERVSVADVAGNDQGKHECGGDEAWRRADPFGYAENSPSNALKRIEPESRDEPDDEKRKCDDQRTTDDVMLRRQDKNECPFGGVRKRRSTWPEHQYQTKQNEVKYPLHRACPDPTRARDYGEVDPPSCISRQITAGLSGVSRTRAPVWASASSTALATTAWPAIAPPSPIPLTPRGLSGDGDS